MYLVTVTFSAIRDMSHAIYIHLQAQILFTGMAFDLRACLLVACTAFRQIIKRYEVIASMYRSDSE